MSAQHYHPELTPARPEPFMPATSQPRWMRVPIYRLQLLGDPVLREHCVPFEREPDAEHIEPLVAAMTSEVERFKGYGLAANQVGAAVRVIITNGGRPKAPLVTMINPVIISQSFKCAIVPEACLSVPRFEARRMRHHSITVSYLNETFEECQETLAGISAQIIQHELDHLDGVLITDGVSEKRYAVAVELVAKARVAFAALDARKQASQ